MQKSELFKLLELLKDQSGSEFWEIRFNQGFWLPKSFIANYTN